jgi:hypothetical protein
MKRIFATVSTVLQSISLVAACANVCATAYAESTGGSHTPFPETDQSNIAMNFAGLAAVDGAANAIAAMRGGVDDELNVSEEGYLQALEDIATNWEDLSNEEKYAAAIAANVAWRAGQPFRSLERLTRSVNVNFNMLPANEKEKDRVQLQAAAKFLLQQIGNVAAS